MFNPEHGINDIFRPTPLSIQGREIVVDATQMLDDVIRSDHDSSAINSSRMVQRKELQRFVGILDRKWRFRNRDHITFPKSNSVSVGFDS